jgi:uncharacterized protein YecT (DUF1311 family)
VNRCDVRRVDWKNFHYEHFELHDGGAAPFPGVDGGVDFERVEYGDFSGDGIEDAIVYVRGFVPAPTGVGHSFTALSVVEGGAKCLEHPVGDITELSMINNITAKFAGNATLVVVDDGWGERAEWQLIDGKMTKVKTAPAVAEGGATSAIENKAPLPSADVRRGSLGPDQPSDAECQGARAAAGHAGPTTREINEQAAAKSTVATCDMRRAYDDLKRLVAAKPEIVAKLAAAQASWSEYRDAHDVERFPHQQEQNYYGTVLLMCQFEDREATTLARTREFRGVASCAKGASTSQARQGAQLADGMLNDAYGKVLSLYVKEPTFLAAFQRAQAAWVKWRDAQVGLAIALGGSSDSACAVQERERVVRARTEMIRTWLKPQREGDVCRGSFGPP